MLNSQTHPRWQCFQLGRKRYDKLIEAGGIDLQLLGIGHNGIGFEPDEKFSSGTQVVHLAESTIQPTAL